MSARVVVMCMTCNATQGWSVEDWNAPEVDAMVEAWLSERAWLVLPTNDRRRAPVHVCVECVEEIQRDILRAEHLSSTARNEMARRLNTVEASLEALAREVGRALVAATLNEGEELAERSDHAIVATVLRLRRALLATERDLETWKSILTHAEHDRDVMRTALGRALGLDPETITLERAQAYIVDWEARR